VSLPLRLVLPPLRVPFDTRSVRGREGQPAELELERVMGIEPTLASLHRAPNQSLTSSDGHACD